MSRGGLQTLPGLTFAQFTAVFEIAYFAGFVLDFALVPIENLVYYSNSVQFQKRPMSLPWGHFDMDTEIATKCFYAVWI